MKNDEVSYAIFNLPIVYKRIIESEKPNVIMFGGRLGGKTTGAAILCVCTLLARPYTDVIFARVSYGSLADSSFAEMEKELDMLPETIRDEFTLKKSPLRIERANNSGTVYFMGYGGSNTSRTKSFVPTHPISMVVLEETQELKNRENLEQIKASLQRHYSLDGVKFCVLGNPPPQKAHWFNKMIVECQEDADWDVVHISYLDILPFINDYDLKDILKTKIKRPDFYDWFYMGNATGAFGSVYPMFDRNRHLIKPEEFSFFLEATRTRILAVVMGGDGAVNRDETVFLPQFILSNGQSVVGPPFIHNPKKDAVVGSHELVNNMLVRWFEEVLSAYNLGTMKELQINPYARMTPIYMRIDSAATDLIQCCKFTFGARADVGPYKKSSIVDMVGTMQSAIYDDRLYLIDYGGYFDYYLNQWIKTDIHPVAEQLEMLIWNEKQDGYDPMIPNDRTDALTYGTGFWFGNTENMNWLNILNINSVNNTLIRDIIKVKED